MHVIYVSWHITVIFICVFCILMCKYIVCYNYVCVFSFARKEAVQTMRQQNVSIQHSTSSARTSIWDSLLINFLSSSYHHWWKGKPWHVNGRPLNQVRAVVCITYILNSYHFHDMGELSKEQFVKINLNKEGNIGPCSTLTQH